MKRKLSLFLALITLLMCGCTQEEEGPALGSQVWETQQLTYGVMEYEKLQVLPWDSGRCEATSNYTMAETREGYYMNCSNMFLLYADKADMGLWVPVCNRANCAHITVNNGSYNHTSCNAFTDSNCFYIKDGRIWYRFTVNGTALAVDEGYEALLSMEPDGTDKRVEISNGVIVEKLTTPRSSADILFPGMWLYNMEDMTEDGSLVVHCYINDGTGWKEYAEIPNETSKWMVMLSALPNSYGDPLVYNAAVSESQSEYLRFSADGYEVLTVPGFEGYVSGDIFRHFRPNDGYYDYNLKTQEVVKLADARMENGYTQMLLPNCIVESTLLRLPSIELRTPGMSHSMEIFDGRQWHTVTLPNELLQTDNLYLLAQAVTADSILFLCLDQNHLNQMQGTTDIYRIDLTKDNWVLEYVTQLQHKVRS